jgi:hypothetical protein
MAYALTCLELLTIMPMLSLKWELQLLDEKVSVE